MNPIVFALRHPVAVMVAIMALVGGSALAVQRLRDDTGVEVLQVQRTKTAGAKAAEWVNVTQDHLFVREIVAGLSDGQTLQIAPARP